MTATAVVVAVAVVALVGVGALTPDSGSVDTPLAVPIAAAAEFRHLAQAVKETMPRTAPAKGAEVVSEFVALSGVGEMGVESLRRSVRFRYSIDAQIEVQNSARAPLIGGLRGARRRCWWRTSRASLFERRGGR